MEFRGTAETREHPKPMVSTVRIMVVPRQWVGHFLNAGLLLYFSFPPLPSPLSRFCLLLYSLRRLSFLFVAFLASALLLFVRPWPHFTVTRFHRRDSGSGTCSLSSLVSRSMKSADVQKEARGEKMWFLFAAE